METQQGFGTSVKWEIHFDPVMDQCWTVMDSFVHMVCPGSVFYTALVIAQTMVPEAGHERTWANPATLLYVIQRLNLID